MTQQTSTPATTFYLMRCWYAIDHILPDISTNAHKKIRNLVFHPLNDMMWFLVCDFYYSFPAHKLTKNFL